MRIASIQARLLAATAFCAFVATPALAADNGVVSSDGTPIDNPFGSTIQGDLNGILAVGSQFNLTNEGRIRGDGTTGGISFSNGGVVVTGGPANIVNFGNISGARFGITTLPFNGTEGRAKFSSVENYGDIIGENDDGVRLQGGGTVINGGNIVGMTTAGADGVSIFNFSDQDTSALTGIGSVTNNGFIEGNRDGIIISGGGAVDNHGIVTGNSFGIVIQTQVTDPGKTGSVSNASGSTVGGGVGFFSLSNAALTNAGWITSSSGAGVISSGGNSGGLSVTNGSSGLIEAATDGVHSDGSSLTLNNAGTIRGDGSNNTVNIANGGVIFSGGPATITNSGTISGARLGLGNTYFDNNGVFEGRAIGSTVTNSGSIIGDFGFGVRLIGGGSVTNSGYIAGRVGAGADGITMFAYNDQNTAGMTTIGSVTNLAGGLIEGNRWGVFLIGGGSVDNAGTINHGINITNSTLLGAGQTGNVTNSGSITSFISLGGLATATVNNSGTTEPVGFVNDGTANLLNSGTVNYFASTSNVGTANVNNSGSIKEGLILSRTTTANITNSGSITATNTPDVTGTTQDALYSEAALTLTNTSTGSITGFIDGVRSTGASLALDNSGTIRGDGTTGGVSASNGGVVITGGPANITNSGTISGARFGITTLPFNGTTNLATFSSVNNGGTIIGDNDDGIRLQGGGSVVNTGYIAGRVTSGADGVSIFPYTGQTATGASFGSLDNQAGGVIEGFRFGAILSGGGTLSNAGTISGGATSTGLRGAVQIQGDSTQSGIINNSGSLNGNVRLIGLGNSTVTNSGTIVGSSSGSALLTDGPMSLTNSGSGSISGVASGVFSSGATFSLNNAATIRGNGVSTDFNAPAAGVLFTGGSGTVTNSGTISGGTFGVSTFYFQLVSGTNQFQGRATFSNVSNSGSIIGDNDDGVRLIGGGSVTNSGYIAGRLGSGADGVSIFPYDDQDTTGLAQAGSVTNNSTGVIEGNRDGIILSGGGTVTNAGSITGNSFGVVIQTQATDHGRTGTLTNSGTINGGAGFFSLDSATLNNSGTITSATGPAVQSNGALSITNSGTINGTGSTAILLSDLADTVELRTGSSINGAVDGGTGTDTLRLSGTVGTPTSSQTVGQFLNFENLNVLGGYWTAAGNIGTFASTTVGAGTLAINGSITSPITVNAGAVLAGTGTITGNVGVNGSLNPAGSSIGTLTINGGVTFGSGSAFSVNTNPNGTSDKLIVNGALTINTGATVQVLAGIFTYPSTTTSYTIVTATGGITGKFDKPVTDYAYYNASVNVQKKGTVTLNLTPNGKPLPSAATPATFSAALAVESLGTSSPLYQHVLSQSLTGARAAFSAFSGSSYARLDALMARDVGDVRLELDRSDADAPRIEWSGVNSLGARGFNSGSLTRHGGVSLFMVGGRSVSRLSSDSITGDIDSRFLASAAAYRSGRFQALAAVTSAWHDVSVARTIAFPGFAERTQSHYRASTHRIDFEGSYQLGRGPVAIAPYGGYAHLMISSPAFSETGGLSALAFGHEDRAMDQLTLGLRAAGKFRLAGLSLSPHLDAAIERTWGAGDAAREARFTGGGTSFDSGAYGFNRRSASLDAGLDLAVGPATLTASYRTRLGDQWSDRTARVAAALRF